jgi:hypothetical protein
LEGKSPDSERLITAADHTAQSHQITFYFQTSQQAPIKMTSSIAEEKAQDSFTEDVEQETSESIAFKKKEAALLRKLDLFIAPVMMMLMLISYLDRGNIGFAATQGMITDINLKGSQLNVCLQHPMESTQSC